MYLLTGLEGVHEAPVEPPDGDGPEPQIGTETLGRAEDVRIPLVGQE